MRRSTLIAVSLVILSTGLAHAEAWVETSRGYGLYTAGSEPLHFYRDSSPYYTQDDGGGFVELRGAVARWRRVALGASATRLNVDTAGNLDGWAASGFLSTLLASHQEVSSRVELGVGWLETRGHLRETRVTGHAPFVDTRLNVTIDLGRGVGIPFTAGWRWSRVSNFGDVGDPPVPVKPLDYSGPLLGVGGRYTFGATKGR